MKNLPLTATLVVAAAAVLCSGWTLAQSITPVVYPAQQQSPQQQERDRFECYEWAKAQSGHDPAALTAPAPAATPATGGLLGSAVLGQARSSQARQQQAQQQQAAKAQQQNAYGRAFGACLEARGYVVR